MNIVLSFIPFIAFALLSGPFGPVTALLVAALASALLLVRGRIAGESPKILELGSFVLFAGLAAWCWLGRADLSPVAVKLAVDVGLLAIVLISMAIGRPFTLQYAREQVPPEYWQSPRFLRVNQIITGVWALAFLAGVVMDLVTMFRPAVPTAVHVAVVVVSLLAAIKFTQWYPKKVAASRASAA
jgi:hypothetical protein